MKFQIYAQVAQAIEMLPQPIQAAALLGWSRICEQFDAAEKIDDWPNASVDTIVRMLGCSEYAATVMQRQWRWFCEAVRQGTFETAPQWNLVVDATDDLAVKKQLREYRHRKMLHILWREYSSDASLGETLASLSRLPRRLSWCQGQAR